MRAYVEKFLLMMFMIVGSAAGGDFGEDRDGGTCEEESATMFGESIEIIEDGSMAAMGVTSGLYFRNRLYNPKYGYE